MKAADFIKSWHLLKGTPLKVHIGRSEHLVTFVSYNDQRTRESRQTISINCSDRTVIWSAQISRIEFSSQPTPEPPQVEPEPDPTPLPPGVTERLHFCIYCKKETTHIYDQDLAFLTCKICGK